MTRGTVTKLLLLGNLAAIALVVWTTVYIVRHPEPPTVSLCPHDHTHLWCVE
jgi:hypothetical protein